MTLICSVSTHKTQWNWHFGSKRMPSRFICIRMSPIEISSRSFFAIGICNSNYSNSHSNAHSRNTKLYLFQLSRREEEKNPISFSSLSLHDDDDDDAADRRHSKSIGEKSKIKMRLTHAWTSEERRRDEEEREREKFAVHLPLIDSWTPNAHSPNHFLTSHSQSSSSSLIIMTIEITIWCSGNGLACSSTQREKERYDMTFQFI